MVDRWSRVVFLDLLILILVSGSGVVGAGGGAGVRAGAGEGQWLLIRVGWRTSAEVQQDDPMTTELRSQLHENGNSVKKQTGRHWSLKHGDLMPFPHTFGRGKRRRTQQSTKLREKPDNDNHYNAISPSKLSAVYMAGAVDGPSAIRPDTTGWNQGGMRAASCGAMMLSYRFLQEAWPMRERGG